MIYINKILDQLNEYSGIKVELVYNSILYCPAMSSISNKLKLVRIIEINPKLIPDDINITAHILSHEFGHHYLNHVLDDPMTLSKKELDIREDEADTYASVFIDKFNYDKQPIIDFIIQNNPNYCERIKILNNTL